SDLSTSSSASLNMASCGESASSGLRSDLGANSLWRSRATCSSSCATFPCANSSICLSRTGSSGSVSGAGIMAPDYTGSGNETRCQDAVRAVAPEINAVEQPVQFIDRQLDGLVPGIGLGLETLGFQTLEPQAEAVAFPVEDFHLIAGAVEEHEQHRVEHFHLDIQRDQGGQAVDGFTKVDGLGVEVDLLDLGVRAHHGWRAPMRNGERSILKTAGHL